MARVDRHLEVMLLRSMCRLRNEVESIIDKTLKSLHDLLGGVRKLRATKPRDEAFILATLLDLPTENILGLDGDVQVASLYSMLSQIPRNWVFFRVPRVSALGNMWAPKTLLLDSTSLSIAPQGPSQISDETGCYITDHGLKGEFSVLQLDQVYANLTEHVHCVINTRNVSADMCFATETRGQIFRYATCTKDVAFNTVILRKKYLPNRNPRHDYDGGKWMDGQAGMQENFETDEALLVRAVTDAQTDSKPAIRVIEIIGAVGVMRGNLKDLTKWTTPYNVVCTGSFVELARVRFADLD